MKDGDNYLDVCLDLSSQEEAVEEDLLLNLTCQVVLFVLLVLIVLVPKKFQKKSKKIKKKFKKSSKKFKKSSKIFFKKVQNKLSKLAS